MLATITIPKTVCCALCILDDFMYAHSLYDVHTSFPGTRLKPVGYLIYSTRSSDSHILVILYNTTVLILGMQI